MTDLNFSGTRAGTPNRGSYAEHVAGLTDAISAAPDLPGALCRGSREWDWDQDDGDPPEEPKLRDARLARATFTCRRHCPELEGCRAYLESLPRAEKPSGAMAGRIVTPPGWWQSRQNRSKRSPRPPRDDEKRKPTRSTA